MAEPITIKINEQDVIEALQRLRQVTNNLRPLMINISEIMLDDVMENFEQQGRPCWPDLAEVTKEKREQRGYWPGKILQMRGELAASIQNNATDKSAIVSTNKVYAAIHQFGGMAGRGRKVKIPVRPFMVLSSQALQDILSAIEDYMRAHI